jgi:VWFA-related protein
MLQRAVKFCLILVFSFLFSMGVESQAPAPASPAPTLKGPSQQPATQSPQAPAPPPQQQQRPATYEPATVLRAIIRLVVVDVVATTKKGEAVTDLKKEDFTVLEDGKEQQIRAFTFQHPAAAGTTALARDQVKLPPNVFTNALKFNLNAGALNVILLDALNTSLLDQAYAREQMLKYLEKMPEGQPIAVYLLGNKLQMLQDFTTDHTLLKNLVRNLKVKASALQDNPAGGPGQQLLPTGFADAGLIPAQMVEQMQKFEQERIGFQTDLRVRYTVDALTSLARALSGYPGRKNLIWISETFPININPDLTLSGDVFASTRNYAPQIAQAAEALVDAQVAVYPVDARGLVAPSVFSASNTGVDTFGRSIGGNGSRLGTNLSNESAALQATHGTMQEVAERTGGKAFYNRNDIDNAIAKSIEDGSTYYTLAYYPENKEWNGKFRKIGIKVNRPGITLRHRLGYYSMDPKTAGKQNPKQQAAELGDALNIDYPVSTGLRFEAGVIQPSEKTQNKVLVNFAVDPHAVSFELQADGTQAAKVDYVVEVFSYSGKVVQTESSAMEYALPPDAYKKVMRSVLPFQKLFDLAPGDYLLRLAVRDNRTGLIGTANGKVSVAQASPAPAAASPAEKKP